MGRTEFERLKKSFSYSLIKTNSKERFRFGPSKIYDANIKVKLKLRLDDCNIDAWFYVVDGEIPILLGNDVLEPLRAKIDMGKNIIEPGSLKVKVPMIKSCSKVTSSVMFYSVNIRAIRP